MSLNMQHRLLGRWEYFFADLLGKSFSEDKVAKKQVDAFPEPPLAKSLPTKIHFLARPFNNIF